MGNDVVAEAVRRALSALIDRLGVDGWDQPPSLWLIHRALTDNTLTLALHPLPTGPLFHTAPPGDVLTFLARAAERLPRPPGGALCAVALAAEAWMVLSGDPGALDAAHARPDRVEIRMVHAVDTAGVHYSIVVPRDPRVERQEIIADPSDRSPGDLRVGGAVVAGLAALLEALT